MAQFVHEFLPECEAALFEQFGAFSALFMGRWRSPQLPSCANKGMSWMAGSVRL